MMIKKTMQMEIVIQSTRTVDITECWGHTLIICDIWCRGVNQRHWGPEDYIRERAALTQEEVLLKYTHYKHIQHSSSPIIIIIWFIIVQALIIMYLILQRLLVFTAPVVWFKVRFCQTESETAAHVPHAEAVSVSTAHSSHALIITVTRSLSKLTSVTFTKIIISFKKIPLLS